MTINRKATTINFRLSLAEKNTLEMIARREGFSNLSETARALIRESFTRRGEVVIGLPDKLPNYEAALYESPK